MNEIGRDEREKRRWGLMAQLAASLAGGAQTPESAKSAFEYWQELMDAVTSEMEKEEQHKAEEARINELLVEQRRENQMASVRLSQQDLEDERAAFRRQKLQVRSGQYEHASGSAAISTG